jgi:uncharacterized membrane protein
MPEKRSIEPEKFLTSEESLQITEAIKEAEKNTSAELKLMIIRRTWRDIWSKAAKLFVKMGLDKTAERNCAMILLVTANRNFIIFGDQGIHEKVGQDFWNDVRDEMLVKFKEDKIGEGLSVGVKRIGEKLAQFFPYREGDQNEISDEIGYEK